MSSGVSAFTTVQSPQTIEINLEGYVAWNVHFKGKTVTVTPEEIFAAIAERVQ